MTETPYQPPEAGPLDGPTGEHGRLKHSVLGIASFVISMVAGVGIFAVLLAAGFMEASNPGGIDEDSPQAILIGLCIIGGVALNLLGAALGIAGVLQADRSRVFGIIGLVFNGLLIVAVVGLMVLGLSVDG